MYRLLLATQTVMQMHFLWLPPLHFNVDAGTVSLCDGPLVALAGDRVEGLGLGHNPVAL